MLGTVQNFEQGRFFDILQICDGTGDPCDALCGGAGCGHCGGKRISCEYGAVRKAEDGLAVADMYASQISNKLRKAEVQNREVV